MRPKLRVTLTLQANRISLGFSFPKPGFRLALGLTVDVGPGCACAQVLEPEGLRSVRL